MFTVLSVAETNVQEPTIDEIFIFVVVVVIVVEVNTGIN